MRDIPVFTTDHGVASLTLKEIPVRGIAYVKLLSSLEPEELLKECVEFCRACGAERIYASGDPCLENYPLVTVLVEMGCAPEELEETDAAVFPVTEETVGQWCAICNVRMAEIPNAAYLMRQDEKKLLQDGDCYFVHRDGQLLGIGKASGDRIDLIASIRPGAGRDVVLAMAALLCGDSVKLTVAQENLRAVRLYRRLGFVVVGEVSRWYKIL